jgi:3-oxoacyl-[acyl-carrier-protein] synthase II
MTQNRSVAVTGIGIYTSIGNTREDFWNSLINGKSGTRRIQSFDPSGHKSQVASEIISFNPDSHLDPKVHRKMARSTQLAVCSAMDAVKDAHLDLEKEDRSRIGCVIGCGAGGITIIEEQYAEFSKRGPGSVQPLTVPKSISNMPVCQTTIILGLYGPSLAVAAACATGAHSIGAGLDLLRQGRADVVLAGATESTISPFIVECYDCMGVLSRGSSDPASASRPFDLNRDGFVIAEGACVLVLETHEHASRRGAIPLADLNGFGITSDAFSIFAPEPTGDWAAAAMEGALKDAGLTPGDIGYVNAHGTATKANDRIETIAIKRALKTSKIPVSSNKSMIGHALGAAGAIEAAATVLTLYHGILPPTINYETPDPECDLDVIPNKAREVKIKAALSNSFGFGGQNGTLAFTRFGAF